MAVTHSGDVFESWLAAREPALQRTAALLVGDAAAARALLRPVLARTCADWRRTGADRADEHALALLAAAHRRTWGRADADPSSLDPAGPVDDLDGAARAVVESLPPRPRAVVVLRHHRLLDQRETARVLAVPVATVADDEQAVVDALDERLREWRRTHDGTPPSARTLLGDTLHAVAEQAAYVPSDPTEVRGDARRLTGRRRRMTALAGLAGVAVLVAAVALVDPLPEDLPEPDPPPTLSPAGSLDLGPLDELEPGSAPRVPHLVGSFFVDAKARVRRLEAPSPIAATRWSGDLWVTTQPPGAPRPRLVRLDRRGRTLDSWPTVADPVVSPDGRHIAWVESGSRRALLHVDGDFQRVRRSAYPVGFLGDEVVYTEPAPARRRRTRIAELAAPPRSIPGVWATSVDPVHALVAGLDDRQRGVVVDAVTGAVRWTSSRWAPARFSPDGRRVVAARLGPEGPDYTVLSAATGRQVARLELGPDVAPLDVRWEDDDHLLVLATAEGLSAFVRVDLTGEVELASGLLPGDVAGRSEYHFATR